MTTVTKTITAANTFSDSIFLGPSSGVRYIKANASVQAGADFFGTVTVQRQFPDDDSATWRDLTTTYTAAKEDILEEPEGALYRIGIKTSGYTAFNISAIGVTAAGTAFTSVPTITLGSAGSGSGATFAPHMKLLTATQSARGIGYAPAQTITLAGGTSSTAGVVTITNTALISATNNAPGTGYNANDTITLTAVGGTMSTPAVITVDTVSGSAIATFHVTTAGVFSANSTSFTQASSSGAGTGATFNAPVYGVGVVSVTTAGDYTVLPGSMAFTQASSSGAGTGATFGSGTTAGVLSVAVTAAGSQYASGTTAATSGGGGSGATLTVTTIGGSVTVRLGQRR